MDLAFLCLGWLAGVFLGDAAAGGMERTGLLRQMEPGLAALAAAAAAAVWLARGDRKLVVSALAVALAVLGAWRALAVAPALDPLEGRTGPVVIHGTISGRPEPRDTSLLLAVDVDEVASRGSRQRVHARVLIRTDRYGDWAYGDRVSARGELRPVRLGSGYWAEKLARQGIHSTLEYPTMRLEGRAEGPDPGLWISAVRDRLEEVCVRLLPEPQASLLAGILVGGRATMPEEFRDALNATGTSHIVAVSGFNVAVVAGMAQLAALRFLARREATLAAIGLVWLYALLTGLPPSALRAALMGTMALLAVLVGRGGDALSFLCLSAALMVGFDPLLLHDLGFQLSFLATAGLVLLEPPLRAGLARLPGWLAAQLSVTLAAQVATLPVLALSFHRLSPVSPLANLLIVPVLPGLMAIGAVAAALGAVAEPLGQAVAPAAWLYLTYVVEAIRWTARLPGASLEVGDPGAIPVLLCYLLLLAVATWPMPEARQARDAVLTLAQRVPRWALAGAAAAGLSLAILALVGRPDGRVHVYFLDVGHGDATLIRSAEGYQVLVDGGPSPTALAGALGSRLGFLDRGLDAVVVTGYGSDRLGGLLGVVRRHPVAMVVQPAEARGPLARPWTEALRDRGIPIVRAETGQRIALGPAAWLEVVWAPPPDAEDDRVAMAVRLVAAGAGVLLPGDLPRGVQADLARSLPAPAAALRVPRHGASGALDPGLAQSLAPAVAVVSVQADNRQGHPADTTLALLRRSTVLRTDRHGTVEVVLGREGVEVVTER